MGINTGASEKYQSDDPRANSRNINEIAPSITYDKKAGLVRIELTQPVEWLDIQPDKALVLAMALIKAATRGLKVKD